MVLLRFPCASGIVVCFLLLMGKHFLVDLSPHRALFSWLISVGKNQAPARGPEFSNQPKKVVKIACGLGVGQLKSALLANVNTVHVIVIISFISAKTCVVIRILQSARLQQKLDLNNAACKTGGRHMTRGSFKCSSFSCSLTKGTPLCFFYNVILVRSEFV